MYTGCFFCSKKFFSYNQETHGKKGLLVDAVGSDIEGSVIQK